MKNYPVVSILSTFKDSKAMLKLVMDSILIQSYPSIEHVVTDSDSKDGSVELLKEYDAKYSAHGFKLVWKSEPDMGIADGYNKAAKLMTGEYFIISMSDPFVSSNSLRILMENLYEGQYDGVYGGINFLKKGIIIRRWSGKKGNLRLGWMAATETICIKKSIYEKHGFLDGQYKISSDYDFQFRIFSDKSLKFKSVPVPIFNYIAGGTSNGSIANNILAIKEDYAVIKEHKVKGAWFTLLCKCARAGFAYVFASRKKISSESIIFANTMS